MSRGGRGGRGGRGRGGRGPGADMMRDTLEDIGVNSIAEHPVARGDTQVVFRYALPADFALTEQSLHRLENSPYFITLKAEDTDIIRYSDKYRKKGKEVGLMECINNGISDSTQYVPAELLSGSNTGGRSALYTGEVDDVTRYQLKRKRDVDLQKLEQQETAGGEGKKASDSKRDESDAEDDEANDHDEFEMDDDYGVDHYASGDDGGYESGGDGGEAFF